MDTLIVGNHRAATPLTPDVPVTALTVSSNIYSLNVFLNTILFVSAFVSGTSWTAAIAEYLNGSKGAKKLLIFAGVMTVLTCCLAIGFGELSRVNSKIQVNYQQDLG